MDKVKIIDTINDFFRNKPLDVESLEKLRVEYDNEWQKLNSGKGCSRCKKNGLRKKYGNKIKEILGRE